jgi:hypothetical protein
MGPKEANYAYKSKVIKNIIPESNCKRTSPPVHHEILSVHSSAHFSGTVSSQNIEIPTRMPTIARINELLVSTCIKPIPDGFSRLLHKV